MILRHPAVSLLGRLLITYIFATSGLAKFMDWAGNVGYMSMAIELLGSACLITGFQARAAAFVMFLYLLAVTLLLHNYWAFSGDLAGMQETHFRKNLAIMGGLLMLMAQGPGKWAVSRERADS